MAWMRRPEPPQRRLPAREAQALLNRVSNSTYDLVVTHHAEARGGQRKFGTARILAVFRFGEVAHDAAFDERYFNWVMKIRSDFGTAVVGVSDHPPTICVITVYPARVRRRYLYR